MTAFAAIDLSRLAPPDVVAPLDYETILASILDRFAARASEAGIAWDAFVESDPAVILLQAAAYEVLLNRATSNDDARALMLAYASGADLDHLAANMGVARRVLDAGDPEALPPVPPVMEGDADLRRRVQVAPEAFTNAGTAAAYIYHALEVDGVLDASAASPAPGDVVVTVLGTGQDTPPALVEAVRARLLDEDIRQLTDNVTVRAATIAGYTIEAALTLYPGPAAGPILAAARDRLDALLARIDKLGHDATRSAIMAALHVEGVQNVDLVAPAADIAIGPGSAGACTAIAVTEAGRDV